MGPCQGRICGPIVSAVIAEARGAPIAEIGTYRPRAPYKPITVGAIAGRRAADTARPALILTTSCGGYAALLVGAALSTITGVSNQVISGAPPYSFVTRSRHSVL